MAKIERNGFLKTWKDDRGFGFIKPESEGDEIFVHISAFEGSTRRPHRGDTIFYQVEQSSDGKSKAINARIEGVETLPKKEKSSRKWIWVMITLLGLIGATSLVIVSYTNDL